MRPVPVGLCTEGALPITPELAIAQGGPWGQTGGLGYSAARGTWGPLWQVNKLICQRCQCKAGLLSAVREMPL